MESFNKNTYFSFIHIKLYMHKMYIYIKTVFSYIYQFYFITKFSSVQFSHSVVSDSLRPHEPQHARLPCLSPAPRVY